MRATGERPKKTRTCSCRVLWLTVASVPTLSGRVDSALLAHHLKTRRYINMSSARHLQTSDDGFPLANVKLPLLQLPDSGDDSVLQPLPSAHLPAELSTVHIYSLPARTPLHKTILEHAIHEQEDCLYGHVVSSRDSPLVGVIGCAAKVLRPVPAASVDDKIQSYLCRGDFRFIVTRIVQEIPFPIVIVDELVDENLDESLPSSAAMGLELDDDDDDEDEGLYETWTPDRLIERMLPMVEEYCQKQLDQTDRQLSPLEQDILIKSGLPDAFFAKRNAAEEKLAVWKVFQLSLPEFAASNRSYYAFAMLAAQLCNLSNPVRQELLQMRNGHQRLVFLAEQLDETVGMERARLMAKQITDETDQASKDLKVGEPQLPPWASSIRKGTELEYYWNEEYEWCRGTVVEEPVKVVDEILLTVYFEDDGTTHRLPLRADEKIRWRPVR